MSQCKVLVYYEEFTDMNNFNCDTVGITIKQGIKDTIMGILTDEDCQKILQNRFNTSHIHLVRFDLSSPESIEGFLGEYYVLKIYYKKNNHEGMEQFFVKTKPTKSDFQKMITSVANNYEKEIFVYGNLLKEFKKSGYPTGFSPECHYYKDNTTLVLDDLKTKGFDIIGRSQFFDLDHTKVALNALANWHANSIAYEEKRSQELGRPFRLDEEFPEVYNEIFLIPNDSYGLIPKFIEITYGLMEKICETMQESSEWKKSFVEKLRKFDYIKVFYQNLPFRKTSGHGDLWSNNLLFKYSENKPVECSLIDYQILRYFHPVYDVLLLIHANTRRTFRKSHINELLSFYYQRFEDILSSNGFSARDILPEEDFLKAGKVLEPVAVLQAVMIRTTILLPTNLTDDAINSGGKNLGMLMLIERPKIILDLLKSNETYRSIFIDDVYSLDEFFFVNNESSHL